MTFFTKHADIDGDLKLEVELRYRKDAGTNWYTGQRQRRGLVLAFTPVEIADRNGYLCKTYRLGDDRGRAFFLEEWARIKPKRGQEVAEQIAAHFDQLAAAGVAQDWSAVSTIIREHIR